MRELYKVNFYILTILFAPFATSATGWAQQTPQSTNYSVLKSDNEPGIAIKSNNITGLSTPPRHTTRFNPGNVFLTAGEYASSYALPAGKYYADAFMKESSPLAQPFLRLRDRNTFPTSYVAKMGFKKQLWTQTSYGNVYASLMLSHDNFPIFSKNTSTEFTIQACWTPSDYDERQSECIKTANYVAQERKHFYIKSYDFLFNQHSSSATIMIDSDGSTNIINNATGCRTTTINNKSGIMCHLFKFLPTQYLNDADTRNTVGYALFRNDARLANLIENDVLISANNGSTWTGLERSVYISNYPIRNDDIYIFFSSEFFRKISSTDLNTFNINSAFYLGLSRDITSLQHLDITLPISSNIKIIPRTVYTMITSHTSGYQTGSVGKEEITFPYTIQENGPTSAERLEISISQDRGTTFNDKCTFYPSNTTAIQQGVPIETYLSFNTLSNGKIKKIIRCDNQPLELRQLGIKDSRAPVYGTDEFSIPSVSRFYDLDLVFNLIGDSGHHTTTGQNWEGQVEQTGRVTFTAVWN
ncbi:hypothetical protein [Aeromonas hydrophila]|uniref:hypothetical protein n=1 Tax=Aeromonas hydrophila TaxID=644 RepID=UPI0013033049|nr:hypothetical protein [Aeromonas hydrophila]QGZ71098.1 hypothetical protein GQR50_00270 [Aeromonas hydrophila]